MRDLYKRLGVAPSCSIGELKNMILHCDHAGLKQDASAVLLVESRRRAYDRLHATISNIGVLRGRLGLSHADNWRGDAANDFSVAADRPQSTYKQLASKLRRTNRRIRFENMLNSIKAFFERLFRLVVGFATVFGVLWLVGIFVDAYDAAKPIKPSYEQSAPVPAEPAFNEPLLPLPASGTVRKRTLQTTIAPLEIKTSAGSNYLVKLEDAASGEYVMDIFVRGGMTEEVSVPLGAYILKYAAGDDWHGYQDSSRKYFGENTAYAKADRTFTFRNEGDRISGYTITLYAVLRGNMSTSGISASEF